MEDLLKSYKEKAITSSAFKQRNRHKHSLEQQREKHSDENYMPNYCSCNVPNTYD